jgi:DNA-binding IclR family transcriptional regulator
VTGSAPGESVLARVVRILAVFEPDRPEVPVTAIARSSGLHVATASRLVAQLVEHGLLERTESGRVRVGLRLWELGQRASPTLSLREVAMPFLEDLHTAVGHHVQLGVLDGTEVIFTERLSAPRAVVNYTRIAGRLPLHASSSGLVLLAHAPAELQERILALPLERLTDRTVADAGELRRLLARIRREGAVVTEGFIHPDATGVAVPVRDGANDVVAALATIQPSDGTAGALVPALRATAHGIHRALSR